MHESGEPHLHCYLRLDTKLEVTDPLFFDLRLMALNPEENDSIYHGNYRSCRSAKAVQRYVTKEGNYISNMDLTVESKEVWKPARQLAREGKLDEALALLEAKEQAARQLTTYPTIMNTLRGLAPPKASLARFAMEDYNFPLDKWNPATTTLLLYGATNVGKTSLAKALLPRALMTRHLDLLKNYQSKGYSGIILDDMSFAHLAVEHQIHLLDRTDDTQIHIRYGVAEIPSGTPVIITSNKPPDQIVSLHVPAIERRCTCMLMVSPNEYELLQKYHYPAVAHCYQP